MENITIITTLLIPMFFWIFKPKDLITLSNWLHDSKIGKSILKVCATFGFLFFIFIDLFIFAMTLLKHEFSVKGFYISCALFIILLSITAGYFYFTFKDLFFPKNNNNQKPFSIV